MKAARGPSSGRRMVDRAAVQRSPAAPVRVADVKEGVRLRSHGPTFSANDFVLNPELLPTAKVGDIIRIWSPDDETKMMLLLVTDLAKVKGNVQLSVSQYIADLFVLPETVKCEVVVRPELYRLEFVVMSVKNFYVARGEMRKLTTMLHGKPLFLRQPITVSGLRVHVSQMWSGRPLATGIVDSNTKVVFRSKSARFFLFLQVSAEMSDFDDDGDLYFEKAIKHFLAELFKRWDAAEYDHTLSVVLFSRSYFDRDPPAGASLHRNGSHYVDYYREVIHTENRMQWSTIVRDLKIAFSSFSALIERAGGRNSLASEGNFLEAINLALNVFDKHYVDRDLRRTGQQIIVVTAGNGHFDVDPALSRLTKRRLMDGIGCDVVCLRPRPLHAVPFFRQFHADGHVSFNIPSWFYVCYVQRQDTVVSCHVRDVQFDDGKEDDVLIPCDDESQRLPPSTIHATNLAECNPFLVTANESTKQTASKRRWINAFFRTDAASPARTVAANPNYVGLLEGINWMSITEPASLPLTTDFFPTDAALQAHFTVHPSIMSLVPLENPYDDNPRLLMKELVYQRLVHGYQIVEGRSRMLTAEEAADKHGVLAAVCYLSMAQDFQIISYDPIVSVDNVNIKIFHKKDVHADAQPMFAYHYNLWNDGDMGEQNAQFRSSSATFSNDKMNYRLWNVLDRFVAGQSSADAFALLKYWRIGFFLLSASATERKESHQKEVEWRRKTVESFNAFRDFLETTNLPKGAPRRTMELIIPDFAVTVTGAPGEVTGARGKLDASEMSALAKRMALDGALIRDRRVGLRTYRDTILGSECVEFIFANVNVASRDEAQALARLLVDFGMMTLLKGTLDDYKAALVQLVRLEPVNKNTAAAAASALASHSGSSSSSSSTNTSGGGGGGGAPSGAAPVQLIAPQPRYQRPVRSETEFSLLRRDIPDLKRGASMAAFDLAHAPLGPSNDRRFSSDGHLDTSFLSNPSSSSSSTTTAPTGNAFTAHTPGGGAPALHASLRSTVQSGPLNDPLLSMRQHAPNAEVSGGPTAKSLNKISITIDTTDRVEWLYVAHDPSYHPNRTFFMSIEWTTCTGSAVYDFVQRMRRKAKAAGLELMQIPLNFYQLSDPFFSPISIPFPVRDTLDDAECEMFQSALLTYSDFLLMQASSFEWVHVSGTAFVTTSNHSLSWYWNSLQVERDKMERGAALKRLANLRALVERYVRVFAGESNVLTEEAEMERLLNLLPLSAVRPKIERLMRLALTPKDASGEPQHQHEPAEAVAPVVAVAPNVSPLRQSPSSRGSPALSDRTSHGSLE